MDILLLVLVACGALFQTKQKLEKSLNNEQVISEDDDIKRGIAKKKVPKK